MIFKSEIINAINKENEATDVMKHNFLQIISKANFGYIDFKSFLFLVERILVES